MKQIFITGKGGLDKLEVRESESTPLEKGQVRIDVKAIGINFADIMARMGLYPDAPPTPCVVGYEVSGTVSEISAGVKGLKKGDKVLATTVFGGYSTEVVVHADQAFKMPAKMTFEEAASIPVNYLTAYLMIFNYGNLQKGDSILIHSAGGGVGIAAIQLAKMVGAEIFGTASESKHPMLRKMGAKHLIDYRTQDFEKEVQSITKGRGVDLVLDAVGGKSFRKSYSILAPLGKLVVFGMSSITSDGKSSIWKALQTILSLPTFKPLSLMSQNRGVFGLNVGHLWSEKEKLSKAMNDILSYYKTGKIKPKIGKTFPFEKVREAHEFIQSRKNTGKVLLIVK